MRLASTRLPPPARAAHLDRGGVPSACEVWPRATAAAVLRRAGSGAKPPQPQSQRMPRCRPQQRRTRLRRRWEAAVEDGFLIVRRRVRRHRPPAPPGEGPALRRASPAESRGAPPPAPRAPRCPRPAAAGGAALGSAVRVRSRGREPFEIKGGVPFEIKGYGRLVKGKARHRRRKRLCHCIQRPQHDSKVWRNRAHCAPRAGGGAAAPPLGAATTLTVSSCPAAQWPSVEHEKWNVPAALSACRYGDASGPASSDPPSKLHCALGTDHTCSRHPPFSQLRRL